MRNAASELFFVKVVNLKINIYHTYVKLSLNLTKMSANYLLTQLFTPPNLSNNPQNSNLMIPQGAIRSSKNLLIAM